MFAHRTASFLQIMSWNINGIKTRKTELAEILLRLEVDVAAIQETHLRLTDQFGIPGYAVYRRDRVTARRPAGGVALLVKRSIPHAELPPLDTTTMEAVAVEITTSAGTLRICSCYQPPREQLEENDLEIILFRRQRGQHVAIGDFNAKSEQWNCRRHNRRGTELETFLERREDVDVLAPVEPTHFSNNGVNDVIDFALIRNPAMGLEITATNEGSSDHNPVLLTLGEKENQQEATFTSRTTDWEKYREILQRDFPPIPRLEHRQEIEDAILALENAIKAAIEASTTTKRRPIINNYLAGIPEATKQLIRERRRAKRTAIRTNDPADRNLLNQLNRRVKAALQEHRDKQWQEHLETLNAQDRSVWKTCRALKKKRKPIPPLHGQNGIVYLNEDKAETFADCLERQFQENDTDDLEAEQWETEVERRARNINRLPDNTQIRHASPEELRDILRSLNPRKAPGCDGIGNIPLKKLPRQPLVALTNIINAALRLQYFPDRWKAADVILFPKPDKDHLFPQNYRPISLLPCMGKLAEIVILKRLKETEEELKIIPDEQFGFRHGHSTEQQVLRMVEFITSGFNNKVATGAVLLDVSKAFDRVWHKGLLIKMLDAGFPTSQVKLVKSFLNARRFRVKTEGVFSTYREMAAGVPQGAVLSPFLYNIYNSDIPRAAGSNLALYADDTAILVKSRNARLLTRKLQSEIETLEKWCARWKIQLNAAKTQAIMFTKRRKIRPETNLQVQEEEIPWRNTATYLGVELDKTLTWKCHTEKARAKAKLARAQLYPVIGRNNKTSVKTKLTLIRTIIQPHLTYASAAWGYAAKSHLKRLQAVENIALRAAVDAPWYVRNDTITRDLKYKTATVIIKEHAQKLFAIMAEHQNPLIRAAIDYDPEMEAPHKRPRHQLLDDR